MGTSVTEANLDADLFFERVGSKNQAAFSPCNPVYLFTNDNVKPMLEHMNLNGKLLSVTASFDHQLNAILLGCKDITSFDLNSMAKYFAELKKEAVKKLGYEEFMGFYKLYRRIGKRIKCDATYKNLDKNTVEKLCADMEHALAYFFERLLSLGMFDITDSTGYYAYITKPSLNMYLDKDKYYELKEKIKDVKFNGYLDKHILSLQDCFNDEVFTAMIFSNITSYMEEHQFDHFERLFKKLEKNLDENGSMQIGNGFINNSFKVTGGDPIDRSFILRFKDNIEEIQTKKEIITYYHK